MQQFTLTLGYFSLEKEASYQGSIHRQRQHSTGTANREVGFLPLLWLNKAVLGRKKRRTDIFLGQIHTKKPYLPSSSSSSQVGREWQSPHPARSTISAQPSSCQKGGSQGAECPSAAASPCSGGAQPPFLGSHPSSGSTVFLQKAPGAQFSWAFHPIPATRTAPVEGPAAAQQKERRG